MDAALERTNLTLFATSTQGLARRPAPGDDENDAHIGKDDDDDDDDDDDNDDDDDDNDEVEDDGNVGDDNDADNDDDVNIDDDAQLEDEVVTLRDRMHARGVEAFVERKKAEAASNLMRRVYDTDVPQGERGGGGECCALTRCRWRGGRRPSAGRCGFLPVEEEQEQCVGPRRQRQAGS